MATDLIYNDRAYTGNVSFSGPVTLPSAVVANATVAAGADIDASKHEHRHHVNYFQKSGTDVVAETQALFTAYLAGELIRVAVRPTAVPTGGDKTYTVDIKKAANGSASFTSVLSAVVSVSSADTSGTIKLGTISTVAFVAGDCYQVVVAVAGSTGTQGQGVLVELVVDEKGA